VLHKLPQASNLCSLLITDMTDMPLAHVCAPRCSKRGQMQGGGPLQVCVCVCGCECECGVNMFHIMLDLFALACKYVFLI